MTRTSPSFQAPAGFHHEAAVAIGWITPPIGAGRCRYMLGRRACGKPAVATLMRGWSKPRPWDYCGEHLYGHWIEAGKVMSWRLVPDGNQIWPHTMDAKVWADEWFKHNGPAQANDHGAMLGWFANAIMAGYDTAQMRAAPVVPAERNGNFLDKDGCCKVCDGEIPHGHLENCDIWKVEHECNQLCAERDALKAALRDVIRESDRDTDAYIRARALLAAEDAP